MEHGGTGRRRPPDRPAEGERVHVHLDHAQHGVGTAACGPGVLPRYELRVGEARFVFRFTAV
ncbi:beta-galactosidase small subunit-related protein [Nonomuraea recticatena]|uniref:hypothetical protein n=1 Tax=Nonomuraea recticatena TaxID=46178 RepID=UPI00361DB87C